MSYRVDTLDCQTCGEVIRRLTPAEAQKVADNPQNFIIDCSSCTTELTEEKRYLQEGPE